MFLTANSTPEPVEGLAVLAHAEDDQEGDRGRLPVEPDPNHRAVQDQADDRFRDE
jgi:hypothetical protein